MKNPFTIGVVSGTEDFCDRAQERGDLLRHARNGTNVVLCSPRRYGKSSLVTTVLGDLGKEGFLTAYVDLFPISSEQDFVTRFAAAVFKGIGRGADPRSFAQKVKGVFSLLRPVIEIVPDGVSISARYDGAGSRSGPLDDLMEGIHRYVKKKRVQACIVLDEFQEITELAEAKKLEGVLRSHIQFQREVSYFYVGSRRRILQDMFGNRSRPFYKSASMYELKEISREDFVPHIERRFAAGGKRCSAEVADEIYGRVRGYPYYVQKLASLAWDATDRSCTREVVAEAFRSLVFSEAIDFEGVWSGLTLTQKTVLKAIAKEPTATPFAREYLERHQLSVGGIQKALKTLLNRDLVEKTEDRSYRLTDPILATWLTA
jgi:uncharacterized protein